MLDCSARTLFGEDRTIFRETVRKVFDRALLLNLERYKVEGSMDRPFWLACGEAGLLCPTVKEENGGLGVDFCL